MWIYLAIHCILVNKTFTVTDGLISQLFVVAFVHPTYVQIALIQGFPVQLSLWKSVHWLWRYQLNEVCDTVLTHSGSAMTPSLAITISKPIKPQIASSPIPLASKPKLKVKFFAQATKANITQQASRFAFASSHKDFLYLLQLKKMFSSLLQAIIISIY